MNIDDLLIDSNETILNAMDKLSITCKKVLFTQKNGKLESIITDGDIRRWILTNGTIEGKVKDAANFTPQYLNSENKLYAKEFMRKNFIEALPIVNKYMEIESIVLLNEDVIRKNKRIDIPVVIMAGGLGTRLYPYTKILPKALIPIGEIPIIEHIINRFCRFNIKEYYLIVNHKKNMIKSYFNEVERDYNINYIDENTPLGTGGGLSLLKGRISTPFILSNCDILVDEDYEKILDFHLKEKNMITMVCSLKQIKIPYGVVEVEKNGDIKKIKEKPQFTFLTNTGVYIVDSSVLTSLVDGVSISFPEIIDNCINSDKKVGVYPIQDENWMDMGEVDQLEKMKRLLECNE